MSACVLCLEVHSSVHAGAIGQYFEIFSRDGLQQEIYKVIKKHFWIELDTNDTDAVLCDKCWNALREFHSFYERIVKIHALLKNINIEPLPKSDPLPVDEVEFLKNEIAEINSDPLPSNDLALVKDEHFDAIVVDPLPTEEPTIQYEKLDMSLEVEQNLFDEEMKVEVNDLELLPQAEVIEDKRNDEESMSNSTTPGIESDEDWQEVQRKEKRPKRPRGRPRKQFQTEKRVRNEEYKRCTRNSLKEKDDEDWELSWRKIRIRNPEPKRMTDEEKEQKLAKQLEHDANIRKMFDKLKCYLCKKPFPNFETIRKHFRSDHDVEDTFYIPCCGRKFKTRRVLAEHVCLHLNPEHFKCTVCDQTFQDGRSLEVHEEAHKNNGANAAVKEKKIFQCDKCQKTFTTKSALQHHGYTKHVPSSEFKLSCPECHKKYPTQRRLKCHMRYTHDPESAFICDKCGKQMRNNSSLKKHNLLVHSDGPKPVQDPVQCELCGTWYTNLSGLRQHMNRIHKDPGGEHKCHICNKISTNARALKRHIFYNHVCERKFKCTMCEKAFKRRQDLKEHTSTHTGEVLYTCPNCPMTFFCNANMYKHRQRLHRAEYEADRNNPLPPNIRRQAMSAAAARKKQEAVSANSEFLINAQGSVDKPLNDTN